MEQKTIQNARRVALGIIKEKHFSICKSGKSADFPDLLFHGRSCKGKRHRKISPQRHASEGSGAANAVWGYDPSREKAILENPQIFQNCEIINNFSADDAQSEAEGILNRPAAPLRIKIAIPAAWCYTTYKGRGLAACALCRMI